MNEHWHPVREGLARLAASLGTLATAAGGSPSVREQVHALAGLWGDLAGIFVSLATVVFWLHRLSSWLLTRRERKRRARMR